MKLPRCILAFTAAALLGACGNHGNREDLLAVIGSSLARLGSDPAGASAEELVARLTPEVRAELGDIDLLIVTLEEPNLSSFLYEAELNADVTTFLTLDGVSLSLRDGILVATRGLGFDLMIADVSGLLPLLKTGGQYTRTHRYLDGEDRLVAFDFHCDVRPGSEIRETCEGHGFSFENSYAPKERQALFARSRQWIGPERGTISIRDVSSP